MEFSVLNVSKKYNKQWVFKDLSFSLEQSGSLAILGANGSGKSTLLKCIAGISAFSSGNITYRKNGIDLKEDQTYQFISFSSPAQELIEEFTLREFLSFHFSMRDFMFVQNITEFSEMVLLQKHLDKNIRDFSSGMKQRLKLALCFFSETSLLLLDEPCTNLDNAGVELYRTWVREYTGGRTLVVASNILHEYDFCAQQICL